MRLKIPFRYSFQNLLSWLVLYLLTAPFLEKAPHAAIFLTFFISLVLFFAVYTIHHYTRYFRFSLIVLTVAIILLWLEAFKVLNFPRIISLLVLIIYLGVLVQCFKRFIFSAKRVDSALICAALCLYLFIGMLWGLFFEGLEYFYPGSFEGILDVVAHTEMQIRQQFIYFSFVTLTTLGYGDILPKTHKAMALCQMEAIVGQFYMAVILARLVGIQVASEFSPEKKQGDATNR